MMPAGPPKPANHGAIVIAGASVRAMAASAVRAGFRVYAADIFGDRDLREVACDVTRIQPYPDGLAAALAGFPEAPWLYTGALENHPRLIDTVAVSRWLAGSSPGAVKQVRDPDVLAGVLHEAGLLFPDTRTTHAGLPITGTWLIKPAASAGGHGIQVWDGIDVDAMHSDHRWQQRIAGHRVSVGYVLNPTTHTLVAASRQLIGHRWCRAGSFAYCGSIDLDPDALDASLRDQVMRLGHVLADRVGLVGLIGADLIIDRRSRMHVIEINPRPTASLELAERATGVSLAAAHLAACGLPVPSTPERRPRSGTWAKAILFAARNLTFCDASLTGVVTHSAAWTCTDGWPAVADIPEPPCPIQAGAPVCTVFAHGRSPAAALALLRHRVAAIEATILG